MTAHAKTQNLLRLSLPVTALVKNEANPNKMAAREFDLLIDNIERTGLTDPILVRPARLSRRCSRSPPSSTCPTSSWC